MAEINHLSIYRGEDIRLNFTVSPVTNITGWTVVFSLRRKKESTVPLLADIAGTITDPVAGKFLITIPAASTLLAPDDYFYDVWRTDVGSEAVISEGKFAVKPTVRKANP